MSQIIDLQGLYTAYCQCRRHKRRTANAQHYEVALLDNLFATLEALHDRSYSPTRSLRFVARKPKAREIHAAHFRDRVVHHWLVPRLEVLYEPIFIHDVYSNRLNKGTHKACERLQAFMHAVGAQGWYLQLDIQNFFNSIDRPILFRLLQHRLRKALRQKRLNHREVDTLRWLVHVLLRHDTVAHSVYRGNPEALSCVPPHKRLGHAGAHKGLPIGNLTSQFFANVYLNELDQWVKHQLKCRYYLRYVDDFILLAESPELLRSWLHSIVDFLDQRLQLRLKALPEPRPVKSGADFLGYIVHPHYRLVRRRVLGNLRDRLYAFQRQFIRGTFQQGYRIDLAPEALQRLWATLASYRGHIRHANHSRLQAAILRQYPWLSVLFDDAWQPRWQAPTGTIVGYRSQLRFFGRQFPLAELAVQRGTERDSIPAAMNRGIEGAGDILRQPRFWVSRVVVDEQGYLKNGLKRRVVRFLFIQAGVLLCRFIRKQ